MCEKSTRSTNSNPVTTGYGYAGESGFQASGIGDDLVDGGSLSAGSGFNLSNLSSSDGLTVNYSKTSSDKDVLSAAGQAIGDAFRAFTGAGTTRQRDAYDYGEAVARGSIEAVDRAGQRQNDAFQGFAQGLDRAGQRQNDAFQGFAQGLDRAGQRNVEVMRGTTQALDRAGQRQLEVQRGTTQALDRAGQRSNAIATAAMSESSDTARDAIDGNNALSRAFMDGATDLAGDSIKEVAEAYGASRESVEGIVGLGFGAASDAYAGALDAMQKNASETADAFARASGGQSQETQITVRKTMLIMGGVVAISMIAANWN